MSTVSIWPLRLAVVLLCLFVRPAAGFEWIVEPVVEGAWPQIAADLVFDEEAGAFLLAYEHSIHGVKFTKGYSQASGHIDWETSAWVDSCTIYSWPDLAVAWPDIFILWAYYQYWGKDVYLSHSSDGGSSFGGSLLVATFAYNHNIAIDPTLGEIVVVYWHQDGLLLRRSQDWGASFLEPQIVDSLTDYIHTMEFAISDDGVYHVAYIDSLIPSHFYYRVNYRRSENQGRTWSYHRLDEEPGRCEAVVLALDDAGNPMIGWIDIPMRRFLFRRSWDQGMSFEPIVPIDTTENFKYTTSIAADAEGNPHLAWWADFVPAWVWYTSSLDSGQTFLPAVPVDPETLASQWGPTIAIGGSGLPVIVWEDRRNDQYGDLWYGAAVPTGVEEETEELAPFIENVRLLPSYPNPFHSSTSIVYELTRQEHVSLRVYDVLGRLVQVLVDAHREAGRHRVLWDGLDQRGVQVSSGIYFSYLESSSKSVVRSMVLLR